jgi:hypothetical protein
LLTLSKIFDPVFYFKLASCLVWNARFSEQHRKTIQSFYRDWNFSIESHCGAHGNFSLIGTTRREEMNTLRFLIPRETGQDMSSLNPTAVNLLISLLVLVFVGILLVGGLLVLRHRRRMRNRSELPIHNRCSTSSKNRHRLTITTNQNGKTESVYVYNEKRNLLETSSSPPPSPVPEIRITFPEEEDESGKRKSGRVVVVRISDSGGVGLEPYNEDLPPYQTHDSDRFQSLDLERMGGLKEKEDRKEWS